MNTYESLLAYANLFREEGDTLTTEELVQAYRSGRQTEVIAYMYCNNYKLFRLTTNRFFGLTQDDKDSYLLEEIAKAFETYDSTKTSKSVKMTSLVCTYIYNRLRTETQALQKASRATLNYATGFDDLGEMDRIEEASEESSFSYAEMYQMVEQLDLTDNEKECCKIIILNNDNIKNSEIAEILGISRAGVGHIKKSLKLKLAPVFNISL